MNKKRFNAIIKQIIPDPAICNKDGLHDFKFSHYDNMYVCVNCNNEITIRKVKSIIG